MSLIIFSHGNSFPASTYTSLFRSLRARGHAVRAVEKFGHDPAYPVTSNCAPRAIPGWVGSRCAVCC